MVIAGDIKVLLLFNELQFVNVSIIVLNVAKLLCKYLKRKKVLSSKSFVK